MALTVKFFIPGNELVFEKSFWTGQMSGFRDFTSKFPEEHCEVSASGDEHDLLLNRLTNIPHAHHGTTWKGEWARFIVDNLIV